jgi:TRAP-type C4-dicarboxylate transport system permease large subunit
MFDPYVSVIASLLNAWQRGETKLRAAMTFGALSGTAAAVIAALGHNSVIDPNVAAPIAIGAATFAFMALVVVLAYERVVEQRAREQQIESVEERVREHPEKPQFAWDLARTKLENYLDRNLAQVRSIYWLTLLVMLCGFGFVMYGLFQASAYPEKLPVSVIASASGVLISFIGRKNM